MAFAAAVRVPRKISGSRRHCRETTNQVLSTGASISAVNYSEAGAKLIDKGFDPVEAFTWLDALRLQVIDFDAGCARRAAVLRRGTREKRLSFADRACLAQAMKEDAIALTTDRVWADLDLACGVELLR